MARPIFEYDIRDKVYDTSSNILGIRLAWYNSLGEEGWEIFKTEGSFNKAYTVYHEYIAMRRQKETI